MCYFIQSSQKIIVCVKNVSISSDSQQAIVIYFVDEGSDNMIKMFTI
jgi:hypothetical protein